jgi:SAM-dependent methyltransferase
MTILKNIRGVFRYLSKISLFRDPNFRLLYVYARAIYFIKIKKSLTTLNSDHALKKNVEHNMKSIFGSNNRMNLLIYPISIIETLDKNSAKILVIGPRNEHDLISLRSQGFKRENIIGLDLISYHPSIILGDMHNIPFKDNSFDAVICGWTLSYSITPQLAADEILRVTNNGGVVAIGVEYSTLTPEDEIKLSGYVLQEVERINSTSQIENLFHSNIQHIYFSHNAPNKRSHTGDKMLKEGEVSNVGTVFSVKK